MTPLYEQYRPRCWAEVVGQDAALKQIATIAKRGLSGRAYWISGLSGTGKTTIARILASELGSDDTTQELDAQEITPARLREVERSYATKPMFGPGWVLIVNEAHGLRNDSIRQLLVMLERLPSYATVIFTTTSSGQKALFDDCDDAGPLLSRCVKLALEAYCPKLAPAFAARAREIAIKEGLDGAPMETYLRAIAHHGCNMRAVLQGIESGNMFA